MRDATTQVELGDDLYDDGPRRRPLGRHPLMAALGALVLFAIGFGAYLAVHNRLDDQRTDSDLAGTTVAPATADTTGTQALAGGTPSTTASATSLPVAATATTPGTGAGGAGALPPAPETGAWVEAALNLDAGPGPGLFRLSGRVPDQETAKALQQAAELSYAPYVESTLKVDPTLPAAPWLAQGARLIGLLPSVTDGTIRVADGKVLVLARSPNEQYLQFFQGALQQLGGGMPVTMVKTTITDLVPPHFAAEASGGKVKLTGDVPSAAIKALLEGGAAQTYGKNVASALTVNPGTYTSFWMYTMPGIFQLFTPFPTYKIQVVNGQASGTLQGGVSFAVDSTEITPEVAKVLNVGVSIMARDPSIYMTVIGYTDASGTSEHNQALSEARARSVAQYFVKAGIGADHLSSMGKGEADPIAGNDDPAGRALNRRVEFTFGPKDG